MSVFVTVGSTKFPDLVESVISPSFLKALKDHGYRTLVIQHGASEPSRIPSDVDQLHVETFSYKPSLTEDFSQADLVLSHAGSGSILQALRLKKRLIIVINTHLMDNHQLEIARAMEKQNYCVCSTASDLIQALEIIHQKKLEQFPEPNPSVFANLLDTHMGFAP